MFFSIVPGMRAARKIGSAERSERRGDLEGASRASSEALEILGRDSVDLETPWCWRPVYLEWMRGTTTPDEREYLRWFEDPLDYLRASS